MFIPSQPSVSLVKTEPLTLIKNELPEEALEEEISSDIKEIDIVYHSLSEDLIKSETALDDILENKHFESVQTQALVVKAENSPFIKTENITERNKSEDTSDGNVSRGPGQGVVEVQGSNEYSNILSNLETDTPLVLKFSKDLNGISTRTRKAKQLEKRNFGKCYKIVETTLLKKDKKKIKVIKVPVNHVEPHEYTSLVKDKHVCNHCQRAYKLLINLKDHIKKMHRKVTTMYQCPYCPHNSKWNLSLQRHIIAKHKSAKDIQWFQCHLCEMKFKLKDYLAHHMKLKHKQMQDGLELNRYHCDRCDFKAYSDYKLRVHKLTHLKPEEIQYFYCYHCSYKSNQKCNLRTHISGHFRNGDVPFHCYICDFMTLKRDLIIEHFKKHPEHHSKCDETNYKYLFETPKRCSCEKCNYEIYGRSDLTKHKPQSLKPKETEYFHCYYCSYKSIQMAKLEAHILIHYRNKDFVTSNWHLIMEHIRNHCKNRNKYDETISKYQLERRINNLEKRFPNNLEDYSFSTHANHIKKQKYEQPESTKSFVSRTESVPENASKIWVFQCTYCPTKFPKEHLLKGHLQLHSSTRGIKCPICTYRHNKTEILKHLSWHGANGEDPFVCPICNLKKRTKENMDDHLKVAHSKAIYEKHDFVCKNKTCNGFCQITIGANGIANFLFCGLIFI